jgi:glutathione S-transferase
MITIYDFPSGARGLRVAWLCEEMGLSYTMMHIGFPPDNAYRALNPFGTVPFLRDGDVSMAESIAIMLCVAQKYGLTDILPRADDGRFAKVLQFTLFGEASLSSPMTPLLAARFGAPDDQKRNWSAVGAESRLKGAIGRLGDEVGERAFLVGSGLTLADISVVTALRIWTRALGHDLPERLRIYCERLQDRPACKRAVLAHTKR